VVKQHEVDRIEAELAQYKSNVDTLVKVMEKFRTNQKERGKSLNRLWEECKKLRKEIVTLQKYCGKLTYDLSVLQLENRITIPSEFNKPVAFLVSDILKQLVDKSGYRLECDLLKIKYPTAKKEVKPSLTITGKEIKK